MVVVETHDPVISLLSHLWPVSAGQGMGDYFRDNLVHLADGEDFNPKGTSSQCNAFQSDNTMWRDNFLCQLGPDLSCGFGYNVLLSQRSYSFQHKILRGSAQSLCRFSREWCRYSLFAHCNPILIEFCKVNPTLHVTIPSLLSFIELVLVVFSLQTQWPDGSHKTHWADCEDSSEEDNSSKRNLHACCRNIIVGIEVTYNTYR